MDKNITLCALFPWVFIFRIYCFFPAWTSKNISLCALFLWAFSSNVVVFVQHVQIKILGWDEFPWAVTSFSSHLQYYHSLGLLSVLSRVCISTFKTANYLASFETSPGFRVRTGHGKPGKSWKVKISKIQAWKTWEISVGHEKSWKSRFLLDQWIILFQFSSLTFSSFLGPPMNMKLYLRYS